MEQLLSKKRVRELVIYSPAHIARLEADGRFPKRVRLGQGRVAWRASEIEDWILAKIALRDASTGS
jgi:prophage regulatory protein